MSASRAPIVTAIENGYSISFDDITIAYQRHGDRYVIMLDAPSGDCFSISEVIGPVGTDVRTLTRH